MKLVINRTKVVLSEKTERTCLIAPGEYSFEIVSFHTNPEKPHNLLYKIEITSKENQKVFFEISAEVLADKNKCAELGLEFLY